MNISSSQMKKALKDIPPGAEYFNTVSDTHIKDLSFDGMIYTAFKWQRGEWTPFFTDRKDYCYLLSDIHTQANYLGEQQFETFKIEGNLLNCLIALWKNPEESIFYSFSDYTTRWCSKPKDCTDGCQKMIPVLQNVLAEVLGQTFYMNLSQRIGLTLQDIIDYNERRPSSHSKGDIK